MTNQNDEEWHLPWTPNERCNCALCRRYRICQKLGMKFELMDSVPADHISGTVPENEVSIVWVADHNLATRNQFETVINLDDEDIEAIAITTMVYYPFPRIATVRVFIDSHDYDLDLLFENDGDSNLDHYARCMGHFQGAY